jgi:hypothetical protein
VKTPKLLGLYDRDSGIADESENAYSVYPVYDFLLHGLKCVSDENILIFNNFCICSPKKVLRYSNN